MSNSFPIHPGMRMPCPACKVMGAFPQAIDATEFPLEIQCFQCDHKIHEFRIADLKQIGKLEPTNLAQFAWKWQSLHRKSVPESIQEIPPVQENIPLSQISFRARIEMLGDKLAEGLAVTDSLEKTLSEMRTSMVNDFTHHWQRFHSLMSDCDLNEVTRLLTCPFSIAPLCPETPTSTASWIVYSSKFYKRILGFPLEIASPLDNPLCAHYIYLVNNYSRISYPIDLHVQYMLNLDEPLDIRVYGRKITGRDVRRCIAEPDAIPDINYDHDHTKSMPSILIGGKEARKWLARHGVNPWPLANLGSNDVLPGYAYEELMRNQLYCKTFQKFLERGRLLLAWKEEYRSIEFCKLLTATLKGSKLLILKDSTWGEEWTQQNNTLNSTPSVAYIEESNYSLASLQETQLLIVDYRNGGVSEALLETLYQYSGNLILISSVNNDNTEMASGAFDCLTTNHEASLLYSLVGSVSLEFEDRIRLDRDYQERKSRSQVEQDSAKNTQEGMQLWQSLKNIRSGVPVTHLRSDTYPNIY